jgi:hypothetical protein
MPSISGQLTASGDSAALIAAPTSPAFIEVLGYQIMGRDSDIDVQIKTGSTVKATVFCPASGVGGISCAPSKEPYLQGAPAEALVINLSGAGEVAYNIQYAIRG